MSSRKKSIRKTTAHCASVSNKVGIDPALPIDDDRYPGSFFRIPGLPTPGKTTWSINP